MKINILASARNNARKIMLLAPLAAFGVPLLWLYVLSPTSFDALWKGRTFELLFVWLILLELILGWESLQGAPTIKLIKLRVAGLVVALLLPTIYVLVSNYAGLNAAIVSSSRQAGIFWYEDMPIAVEYLVFAFFFGLMAVQSQGVSGLKSFSIPIFFSVTIGAVFIIDSVFPNGQFPPFQIFVPSTTMLATGLLNFIGYHASLDLGQGILPQLTVTDPGNPVSTATFGIAWACAGIESLLIFAVITLLFLKRMPLSWRAKVGYFAFGAAVTYLVNVVRIVSLFSFVLGGGDVNLFHQTYGPLYPIAWIVMYPLFVLGTQRLWHRVTGGERQALVESAETALAERG